MSSVKVINDVTLALRMRARVLEQQSTDLSTTREWSAMLGRMAMEFEAVAKNIESLQQRNPGGRPTRDFTGVRFGEMVVIQRVKTPQRGTYWDVKCSCGVIKTMRTDVLKRSKTCGHKGESSGRA